MAIKRNISVTNEGIIADINIVYGTNMLPIEFYITDYVLPDNAIPVLYCTTSGGELFKTVGTIVNDVISFNTAVGFFTVGKNRSQIRITANEKEIYSFEVNVNCKPNMASDDAQEVESQPTLMAQLLTEVANTKSYVNMALSEVENPDIDSWYNGVATERIDPVLPITSGDTLKSILSTLTMAANNEEYNYNLIDEEQLNETAYATLGGAVKWITKRLFDLEAMASHVVRFPWNANDAGQGLFFYRVGSVVITNCALVTYFQTGQTYSYELIPEGYRPIYVAPANVVLFSSYANIGSAVFRYKENGVVDIRTSNNAVAEYNHMLVWITADAFPYGEGSVG